MTSSKLQLRLTCVALTISLALAADWIAGPWFDVRSQSIRWALFLVNMVLTAASVLYLLSQVWSTQTAALRELDLLYRKDIRELADEPTTAGGTTFVNDHVWAPPLSRLRRRLAEIGQRLQELEQQRAAAESRAQYQEAQARRMSAILSGLTDPVVAIDKYDELVLSNKSAEEVLAIPSESFEDRAIGNLVHCERLVELLKETRRRKVPSQRSCEIELPDGDGLAHWYRVTARTLTPQEETDGVGAVAVMHDISSQKAVQKRNAEFVSAVSHEMKTPLAGIKAYVELLVDGDAEDEATQEEFLGIINAQADRLQRLVDNMLNLARIEAGVVRVNKQSRSLNELLEESLQVIQPAAEAKDIRLTSELSPMYLGVHVDRDMALQAVINLLSNAVKYTACGGTVTLRSRLDGNDVHFEVADSGVGLSEEDCKKVFEKFYRVAKDKDMATGTGLGLSLVKHIVEDVHGGHIEVQSRPGQGSVFGVTLPSAGALVTAEKS